MFMITVPSFIHNQQYETGQYFDRIILLSMNNILNHNNDGFQEIVIKNRYGIRSLQAKYLQNEYEKMQNAKNVEKMTQKQQKDREHQMLNVLNQTYLNEVSSNRKKKLRQMESLSMEYEEFIKRQNQKGKISKIIDKNVEKSTLQAPTWIRDVFTQRETYKKNIDFYSKALADHVKLQDMRKQSEKEEQLFRKRKISQQAEFIRKKQLQQLEARHRQKSQFEKRQNELLGIREDVSQDYGANGLLPAQRVHKRREQDIYSKGLQVQLRKQQEKRYSSQDKMTNSVNSNVYNPISNPIPFIYKNPNVLRMMAQN